MLSGRSVNGTCLPAGVMVQPLGSRKPAPVGPGKTGLPFSFAAGGLPERRTAQSARSEQTRRGMTLVSVWPAGRAVVGTMVLREVGLRPAHDREAGTPPYLMRPPAPRPGQGGDASKSDNPLSP